MIKTTNFDILHYHTFKKERKEEMQGKYPWLDPSSERKYMPDREILEKISRFREMLFSKKRKVSGNGHVI